MKVASSPRVGELGLGGSNQNSGCISKLLPGRGSVTFITFNLTKALIGAGIFSFPSLYLYSGFFGCIFLLISSTALIHWSSTMLVDISENLGIDQFEEIVKRTLGKWGVYAYVFETILFVCSGLGVYLVILGDTLLPIVLSIVSWDYDCLISGTCRDNVAHLLLDRRIFTLILLAVILIPLCLLRDPQMLSFTSVTGLICVLFACVAVIVRSADPSSGIKKNTATTSELLTLLKPEGMANAVSTTAFANVCQQVYLIFTKSLNHNTRKNKVRVLTLSLTIATMVSMAFSIPTYLNMGTAVTPNALSYFSHDDLIINISRGLFAANVICTYPLMHIVCREALVNLSHRKKGHAPLKSYMVYAILVNVLAAGLSAIFCNLRSVLGLAGGLSASAIAFIIPQMCWVSWRRSNGASVKSLIFPASTTLVGFILIILTINDAIKELRQGGAECNYILL